MAQLTYEQGFDLIQKARSGEINDKSPEFANLLDYIRSNTIRDTDIRISSLSLPEGDQKNLEAFNNNFGGQTGDSLEELMSEHKLQGKARDLAIELAEIGNINNAIYHACMDMAERMSSLKAFYDINIARVEIGLECAQKHKKTLPSAKEEIKEVKQYLKSLRREKAKALKEYGLN